MSAYNSWCRPAFTLPGTLLVGNDGTVQVNVAPTTPGHIAVPDGIKGGTSINVSWGAATDANDNLAGYSLERNVNGGGWGQVYQGTALSSTQAITKGWVNVAFRVNAYDTLGLESGYATSPTRTIINNSPPSQPTWIHYADPRAGKAIALSCSQSTDPDGDPISYVWERRVDSGVFTQIGITSATGHTDTVPQSGTQYQVRVKAADNQGNESGYFTGAAQIIRYNDPPAITGTDTSLGDLTATGLNYVYTVTDDKTADVAVVIQLDGKAHATLQAKPGQQQTLTITGDAWIRLLNGTHTIVITATDTEGESTKRTVTFIKKQSILEFKLREPRQIQTRPYRLALNLSASMPTGAVLTAFATNNALDAAPVWEDVTNAVLFGRTHIFDNTQSTAGWAVDIHVKVERGTAAGECSISGLTCAFETDGGAAPQMAALTLQLERNEQLMDTLLTEIIPAMMEGGRA